MKHTRLFTIPQVGSYDHRGLLILLRNERLLTAAFQERQIARFNLAPLFIRKCYKPYQKKSFDPISLLEAKSNSPGYLSMPMN